MGMFNTLYTSREKAVKAIMSLMSRTNDLETKVNDPTIYITSTGDVYVYGVGGYDGTNADDPNVKTLQQVLEDLAG